MFVFKDRVALIAGAANDVGEAIALRLGKGDAKLVLADSDSSKVDEIMKKLANAGVQAEGLVVDMENSSDIKKAVDSVVDKLGTIDILVNCMDHANGKPISDCSAADWEDSIKKNLAPVFMFCEEVVSGMKEKKHGRIINLSDLNYLGMPGKANYAAAKSGIFGLTRALALELAKDAITVNCVVKGDLKPSGVEMSEEELAKAAGRMPVKKLGNPVDVAYAVGYFASDTSSYTTGQMLFVCGGKSIYSSMSI
jgi:3-oxoacyl-[acyl-carrier protein] reductase/2-[hydroxy(phenyl)methyl]-succinyl-CoA dehydrogenase BbsC subunit